MNHLFIGIDGGGSHSTAAAVCPDGSILGRAEGPGLNYLNDGLETCVRRFGELLRQFPSLEIGNVVVCGGLAALDGPAPGSILEAFQSVLPPNCRLILESDLSVALAGHTLGRPGLMAVCGTGSMALARDCSGREICAGGWGWKIGDPGSGYSLAREGLFRAAFRAETEGRKTPLLTAALRFFDAPDLRSLIAPLYAPGRGPDALAAFGAEVARLAGEDDPDAFGILTAQMDQFAALCASLLNTIPAAIGHVGLSGGLFVHSPLACALFTEALLARCPGAKTGPVKQPPALGAVILGMLRSGISPSNIPVFK